MRLEKIELCGFKSFADRTVLSFTHQVTAIVGPNGCGKSNIVDAFRWVMGEQSAKSMRGDKMADVIFSGASKRNKHNVAEVALTFTEINGLLPVDYDEVCIKRRLYRSGESEWFINKNPVRLKDIHSLFWDTGLGKDAFCIFEQGKMDAIINSNPIERRFIFEEAARIVRFKERKREALRKLEHTDNNLTRVADIHQEVEQQIVRLEKQAEIASRYKDQKHEMEQLEQAVLIVRSKKHRNLITTKGKELDILTASLQEHETKTETQVQKLQEAKQRYSAQEENLRSTTKKLYQKKSEIDVKQAELTALKKRIDEYNHNNQRLEQQIILLEEKKSLAALEFKNNRSVYQETRSCYENSDKELQLFSKEVQALEESVNHKRSKHKETQNSYLEMLQKENRLKESLKESQLKFDNNCLRLEELKTKEQNILKKQKENQLALQQKRADVNETTSKVTTKKEALRQLEHHIAKHREQLKQLRVERQSNQNKLQEVSVKYKTLTRLKEDMEGCSKSFKAISKAAQDENSPFYQQVRPLTDLIAPLPGKEKLIASAMHRYMQTLVVDTEDTFDAVIAFAKKESLKDFSLICKSHIKIENHSGDLLQLVEKNDLAVHFLHDIRHISTEPTAAQLTTSTLFDTLFTVDHKGVLFQTALGEKNFFQRAGELKTLSLALKENESLDQELTKTVNTAYQSLQSDESKLSELDKELRSLEIQLTVAKFNADKSQEAHTLLQEELQAALNTQQQLTNSFQNFEETKTAAEASYEKVRQTRESLHQSFSKLDADFEEAFATLKYKSTTLKENEDKKNELEKQTQKLLHQLDLFKIQEQEQSRNIATHLQDIEKNKQAGNVCSTDLVSIEQMIALLEQTLQTYEIDYQEAKTSTLQEKLHIETEEKNIEQIRQTTAELKQKEIALQLQSSQAKEYYTHILNELQTRYQIEDNAIDSFDTSFISSLKESEKRIRYLSNHLNQHTDINLAAIKECEEHRVRAQFLKQQMDDLNQAKAELIAIITKLDTSSRKTFKETFETIRASFRKNFLVLFNGGDADLKLAEESDILEAGIEIIAKPPGKQMRSIQLLSGGEKCLTATALLFAIFETQPIPFCLLDEIDAPLDDANIERFTNVLKRFIENNQFIIITHNKRTMAIADVLMGVSMQEKGVSQIIPLEFKAQDNPIRDSVATAVN